MYVVTNCTPPLLNLVLSARFTKQSFSQTNPTTLGFLQRLNASLHAEMLARISCNTC